MSGGHGDLPIFVAAAKRQFILSAAAGGVEGPPAMTDEPGACFYVRSDMWR
jgi:hypothetical protein